MKYFQDAVRRQQENDNWIVLPICDSKIPVDFVCVRDGKSKLIRARGNGHGHLHNLGEATLRLLGKQTGLHVSVASVNGENAIRYTGIYPRYVKEEKGEKDEK